MKPITLHPTSLAIGVLGSLAFFVLTSQTLSTSFPTARVEVGPHPRDMVQIEQGQTYTVPPGKILVVTALGSLNSGQTASLYANRTIALSASSPVTGVDALPPGLTYPWGTVHTVTTPSAGAGRIWGYLADR